MKAELEANSVALDDLAHRFTMYALCILLPLLAIVYGWNLRRQSAASGPQVAQQVLGRQLILAGIAGLVWWLSVCGILWLALMTVLKLINLVP